MSYYIGIDTSNYATSISIYNNEDKTIKMQRQLLEVKKDTVGLRQSDAVFLHIKQFDEVLSKLINNQKYDFKAVGVSSKPRDIEGSYMPTFLVGKTIAATIATILNIKKYECSHQQGHIISALYSANSMDLLSKEFYAFHISGGTTECLLVTPHNKLFKTKLVAKTLDLNAGQIVDRVGVMLGLNFPCGIELTNLALKNSDKLNIKPTTKGTNIHLSGIENQCQRLMQQGATKEYIAAFAIESIKLAINAMTVNVISEYGKKPLLYAGGVMSNSIIRQYISKKHNGLFAKPEFSSDNAAGVAIITAIKDSEND